MFNPRDIQDIICSACRKPNPSYECPQCHVNYCSLACYKKHSKDCATIFQQNQVVEAMEQAEPSESDKEDVLSMLARQRLEEVRDGLNELTAGSDENNEATNETVGEMSEERLLELASLPTLAFKDLSLSEQRSFLSDMYCGKVGSMVQLWSPWWIEGSSASIQEQTGDDAATSGVYFPPSIPKLPLLSTLASKAPHPSLFLYVGEAIFAFSVVSRLYNGEWSSCVVEVAELMFALMPTFVTRTPSSVESSTSGIDSKRGNDACVLSKSSSKEVYENTEQLVRMCFANANAVSPSLTPTALIAGWRDVLTILKQHVTVLQVIVAVEEIFTAALKETSRAKGKELRGKLLSATRKARFFLLYMNEFPSDLRITFQEELSVSVSILEHNEVDKR